MNKILKIVYCFALVLFLVSCSCGGRNAIELMGAGDRIHDSFTFANIGVKIKNEGNEYTIFGSVDKLNSEEIKTEFGIDTEVDYVVAIKLSAVCEKVVENKIQVSVNGLRSYDSEHLNGKNYTFILLEATPGGEVNINVSWDGDNFNDYIIKFADDLILK